MSETIGSLIDRLTTVNLKMWNTQELLYEIRRMTFDEYKHKYFENEDGAKLLWDHLKKACDLNVQRANLVDEIDEKLVSIISAISNGENTDNLIQRKHKTY